MKKFKDTINNLKKTEKGRTLLKLSRYILFLLFVLTLVVISNINSLEKNPIEKIEVEDKPVIKEMETLTYYEKQKKLCEGNYKFKYVISGPLNMVYEGKVKDGVITGYKETDNKTIKYEIKDGIAYEVKPSKKIEINDLYLGLDENLFKFKDLFSRISQKNTIIKRNANDRQYIYKDIDSYTITITLNDMEITNININNNDIKYEFAFTY